MPCSSLFKFIRIEAIVRWAKNKVSYRHPPTYQEELNEQCKLLFIPTVFFACFSWLPFIPVDIALYPEKTFVVLCRYGLSVFGFLTIVIHYLPFLNKAGSSFSKNRNYRILVMTVGYLEIVSALILAVVKADPAYMGGYCIIILLLPLAPFQIKHSLILLTLSVVIFFSVGLSTGLAFDTAGKQYGLINYIISVILAGILVPVLGLLRRHSYFKTLKVQNNADQNVKNFFKEKGISKREEEIVRLILQGKSNNEIEEKLFISLTTVKSHIYKSYQKLGVKSRVQLINLMDKIKKD